MAVDFGAKPAILGPPAMNKSNDYLTQARTLRADILAAPEVWLPRREILLEWLNGFVGRAEGRSFALGETEAADLVALERFLRAQAIPAARA